jgi:hypothetical protein
MREHVAAGGDRLRLLRLDLGERLGRELVRHHASQVLLERHHVHDGDPVVLGRQDLEHAAVGCRVDDELGRSVGGLDESALQLVARLEQADPAGVGGGTERGARQRAHERHVLPRGGAAHAHAAGGSHRGLLDADSHPHADRPLARVLARRRKGLRAERGQRGVAHRAAAGRCEPGSRERRGPGDTGVVNDARSRQEPCGASL